MADEKNSQSSDDWLKVLSVCALLCKDVPDGRGGSAAIAGFVIVGLSIYSRGVFVALHLLATSVLIWFAFASWESLIIGYAVLYSAMSVVLIAEGERLRVQRGHFLTATFWLGQVLLHTLDIRHAHATGGSSGFFTDIFLVISIGMVLRETYRGFRTLQQVENPAAEQSVDDNVPDEEPVRKSA